MKCKFCLDEIADEETVCPLCGKDLTEAAEEAEEKVETAETPEAEETPAEETAEEENEEAEDDEDEMAFEDLFAKPAKEHKSLKTVLIAVSSLLLAEIALVAVLHFTHVIDLGKVLEALKKDDVATAPTGNLLQNSAQSNLLSYTVDKAVLEEKGELVVATVGDQKLTNAELQIHYLLLVQDFIDNNGGTTFVEYLTGLNPSKPLDQQVYNQQTGMTYQEFFLENAIESWRRYATFVQMAKDANFVMTEDQQKALDELPESVNNMAKAEGYTDPEAYVDKYYPGSSVAGFISYNALIYKAMFYFDVLYESLLPTQEEMEAYYTENEAYFVENKQSKEDGLYYDIRHIYIPIEGEGTEVDGVMTYTEEQWSQCMAKAQTVLDDFLADGGTEELFAERAKELSADEYSAANGGLYERITKDSGYVQTFMDWIMDESRAKGDTGLVKNTGSSPQGYHVMYFVGSYSIWEYETKTILLTNKSNTILEEAKAKWPLQTNYDNIVLGQVNLVG